MNTVNAKIVDSMPKRIAIIPAAGLGTRLRPVTDKIPKALIHVGDKPTIGHIISLLESLSISEIVLIVGYLGEMVVDYVKRAFPRMTVNFVEQKELLGLGHAIWLTREIAGGDEVLIIYGDTILEAEIASAFSKDGDGSLGVKYVEDPRSLGVVVLDGERVVKLIEKPKEPPSNLAIIGVSYFRNSKLLYECLDEVVRKDLRTRGEIQATDAFDLMVQRGAYLTTFPVKVWLDCGSVENLLETNRFLLDRGNFQPSIPTCKVIPPVYISSSSSVKNSEIGPYVSIADGASVEDSKLVDCIVERTARIKGIIAEKELIG